MAISISCRYDHTALNFSSIKTPRDFNFVLQFSKLREPIDCLIFVLRQFYIISVYFTLRINFLAVRCILDKSRF